MRTTKALPPVLMTRSGLSLPGIDARPRCASVGSTSCSGFAGVLTPDSRRFNAGTRAPTADDDDDDGGEDGGCRRRRSDTNAAPTSAPPATQSSLMLSSVFAVVAMMVCARLGVPGTCRFVGRRFAVCVRPRFER